MFSMLYDIHKISRIQDIEVFTINDKENILCIQDSRVRRDLTKTRVN